MVQVAGTEAAAVLTVVHRAEATDARATTTRLPHATALGCPHHHLLGGIPLHQAHRASALACHPRLRRRTCRVATMVVDTLKIMATAEVTARRLLPHLTVHSTTVEVVEVEEEEDTKTRDTVSLHLRDAMITTMVEVTVVAGAIIGGAMETIGDMTADIVAEDCGDDQRGVAEEKKARENNSTGEKEGGGTWDHTRGGKCLIYKGKKYLLVALYV